MREEQRPATASASSAVASDGTTQSTLAPPRLSIVVLPFANLSGDPEHDYFVDGVTESLTTDLSQSTNLFVIAHNRALSHARRRILTYGKWAGN